MIFQNIRSKNNLKQTTDLSMQTVFPHGMELQGLGSDVSLPACLVVGDFMVVLVLKGGALWNLCSKPKLIKSRTQTKKTNTSPPQVFQSLPGLPKICATLASLLPWSKGFGLWQGLGRRANTSLEALNKTTKMIHSLQNMFEVMLKIQMIEIRSHVWSQHCQNIANFGQHFVVFFFRKSNLNHLPRWMTVKDTKRFYQSKRFCLMHYGSYHQHTKTDAFLQSESPNTEILTCCRSKSRSSWRCLKYLVTQREKSGRIQHHWRKQFPLLFPDGLSKLPNIATMYGISTYMWLILVW